jgi:hypothetical protein
VIALLPALAGGVQLTVARLVPGTAVTPTGALGTVGAAAPALNTTVAISQVVPLPVPVVAAGVAPSASA